MHTFLEFLWSPFTRDFLLGLLERKILNLSRPAIVKRAQVLVTEELEFKPG